jgi:hypothetical protein
MVIPTNWFLPVEAAALSRAQASKLLAEVRTLSRCPFQETSQAVPDLRLRVQAIRRLICRLPTLSLKEASLSRSLFCADELAAQGLPADIAIAN